MSEPLPLRKVIERIQDGAIRIPGFQRKFVWEPDRAALLMDSIYKGYPFGSILLWRTRTELKTEKTVAGFKLPEPEKDYPIDYVLDGQQRLTSIFATFQTSLDAPPEDPDGWLPIYYNFAAEDDAQESRFAALPHAEVNRNRHFPLNVFFEAVAFSRAVRNLPEERNVEIVNVQERFKEALIPAETFETEDRGRVAIVFERVNRMGVDLDMFELLTAWTWSEEFDLQQKFHELSEEFSDFGFDDVGSDNDLMLRCCAAILKGDPSPASMIDINGSDVRQRFEQVASSLRRAVDFLRTNLQVRHVKYLPYSAQLIPLAAYFSIDSSRSVPNADTRTLLRWFWRSSFGHRYSGNPARNIKIDVEQAMNLREGKPSTLDDLNASVDSSFFSKKEFSARTVASKTLILMLAGRKPLTFLSGEAVSLDEVLAEPNRKEFHHCMPRAWLKLTRPDLGDRETSALANMAIILRAENREIKDKAPSRYRQLMPQDVSGISDAAFLPESLWADSWEDFVHERAGLLSQHAHRLMVG